MKELKAKGKFCKKCGSLMGENIDGKPICNCGVWPMKERVKDEKKL